MSIGPQTEAVFIQENQSKQQDDSHSALFFLFQEVSKLASPISNSFLDINVPSKWLNETSANNHFRFKKEEEDAHSVRASFSSCQQNLSCTLPYHHINTMRDDICNSEATAVDEQRCECNSPWKVLSLINRHCEKLLHQRDDDDLGSGVLSSSTKLGRSAAALVAAAADVAEGGVRGDNVECTLRPSLPLCERQESKASISPVETVREYSAGGGCTLEGCVKGGCSVRPHTAQKTDFVRAELQEKNSLLRRNQEWKKDCSPTEKDVLDVPLHEIALHQTHIPNTCLNTQLTISSDDKPRLTLDHNANISLSTDPQCNTQPLPLLSSQSASLTAGSSHSPSKEDDIFTASKASRTRAPVKDKSPSAAQLKSSSCDLSSATPEPELCTAKKEETGLPPAHQWKAKTPRKQPHPSRSADIQDPEFQGVTFRMDTELDDTKEQCRLLITSKYSKELCKSVRKPRLRARTLQKSLKTSSSDEENDLTTTVLKGKVCASCCTRKTPMWRDAEDGTPLCNACGIRYKKYRVRCVNCWHIPRKESNSNSRCLKCGNFVRLTSAQRKHTT